MMLMDDVIEMTKSIRTRSPIGVIFIDTLAQVTPGANENAGEDMGTLLLHCRMIADVTGALVVLIHHSGKDDSKGARGWSGFRGNADVMHEVTRTGEVRTITVYKMKDGVENTAYGFRLEPVFLDMDEDMELTSSCVVMPVEGAVAHAPSTKKGPNEQRAMADRIIESIGEMQGVRQDTGPVPYDALVTHVEAKMVKPPDDKKDRRGERIRAGIQRLMDSHELEGVNGHVAKVSN